MPNLKCAHTFGPVSVASTWRSTRLPDTSASIKDIVQARAKKQNNMIFRYFWSAFTLLSCLLAVGAENQKSFIQPLNELQAILDEYSE